MMTTIGELFGSRACFEQSRFGPPYTFDVRALEQLWRTVSICARHGGPFPPLVGPYELFIFEPSNAGDNEDDVVQVFKIIDGYRRLASLQLLLGAMMHAAQRLGLSDAAERLRALTDNRACGPFVSFKVAPRREDEQSVFLVAMLRGEQLRSFKLDESGMPDIGLAYEYFERRLQEMLGEGERDAAMMDALIAAVCAMPIAAVWAPDGVPIYCSLNENGLLRISLRRQPQH